MFPKTYVSQKSLTARVCTSCDWLSNAFCIALLQGNRIDDVKTLHKSRNLNLRSCFASIHQEAMYVMRLYLLREYKTLMKLTLTILSLNRLPVHCAVMGGNLQLLRWLVETHGSPLFKKNDSLTGSRNSLCTTAGKTLIDLVLIGKPKLDILRYLVITQNVSVEDTTNPRMALRTLDALLREKEVDKKKIIATTKEDIPFDDDCFSEASSDTIVDSVSTASSLIYFVTSCCN
jgi:hypothetical protein